MMAQFLSATPVMMEHTPGVAVASGDVVIVGDLPCVCHRAIAANALGALAVRGGVYIIPADAAYPNGVYVYWDTAKQQVSTVETATTYPFGWIVGGPTQQLSDGGPIGAASNATVLHAPAGGQQPTVPPTQYTAIATGTPATPTGAQFAAARDVTVNMTAALAGAGTLNTPTAAQIVAAIPGAVAGQSYKLRIINSSAGAFSWTLTAAAGVTLTGTMTIAQNTYRDFYVTLTTLATVTVQAIGTGTQS